jgi:hypothetical protein
MAAMQTCGDFRNEKRVGFFNQSLRSHGTALQQKLGGRSRKHRFRVARLRDRAIEGKFLGASNFDRSSIPIIDLIASYKELSLGRSVADTRAG